jgi:hypothetical protein
VRGLFWVCCGVGKLGLSGVVLLEVFESIEGHKLLGSEIFGCILVVTCKENGVKQSILKTLLVLSGIGLSKR